MSNKALENFKKGINVMETSLSEEQTMFGYIKLKFEVERKCFYAMLAYYLILGLGIFGLDFQQQNILLTPQIFTFESERAADTHATIILFDLAVKLITSPLYRILIDKIGRKNMSFAGFALLSLSLFFFPLTFTEKLNLNSYYMARFIYANGIAILLSVPLLSDYVEHDSKPRCISINGFFLTLGFLFSTYIIKSTPPPNYSSVFYTFGMVTLLGGFTSSWFLKPGTEYYRQAVHSPDKHLDVEDDENTVNLQESPIVLTKRKLALHAIKVRPWTLVALIFSILSGVCFAISGQIFSLYIQTWNTLDAVNLAISLIFKSNIASVVSALIFGPALEYLKPLYASVICFIIILSASFSSWTVEDPRSFSVTLICIGFGMGYSVSHVLSTYLGYKNYPTSLRGIFFTVASGCTGIGIIFTTVFGGWLIKSGDNNWPFYIAGLCTCVLVAVFLLIYIEMIIPIQKKIQNKQELNLSLLYTSIQNTNTETPEIGVNGLQFEKED